MMPIIGIPEVLPNLVIASGHFRSGILLGPITADLVKQSVMGEATAVDLLPFSPDREIPSL